MVIHIKLDNEKPWMSNAGKQKSLNANGSFLMFAPGCPRWRTNWPSSALFLCSTFLNRHFHCVYPMYWPWQGKMEVPLSVRFKTTFSLNNKRISNCNESVHSACTVLIPLDCWLTACWHKRWSAQLKRCVAWIFIIIKSNPNVLGKWMGSITLQKASCNGNLHMEKVKFIHYVHLHRPLV